jgi:hypothetical protein
MIEKICDTIYKLFGQHRPGIKSIIKVVDKGLHSPTKPAILHYNGGMNWYYNNIRHRYYGPAMIMEVKRWSLAITKWYIWGRLIKNE